MNAAATKGAETSSPEQRPLLMVTTMDLGILNGPSLHFLNLAKQLVALGHPVTVVCPKPQQSILGSLLGGLTVRHAANVRRLGLPGALNVFTLAPTIRSLRSFASTLYLRSSPVTATLAMLARPLGMSRVVVEHNGWLSDEVQAFGYARPLVHLTRVLQRAEALRADKIRVVTQGLKAILTSEGVDAAKVMVIGNGTDTQQFRPMNAAQCRSELGITGDEPLLGFVGNLWAAVDLGIVFEAMAILKRRGAPARIVIAGDGVQRAELERKACLLLGEDAALFLGHLCPERTNMVINAADVVVAPFHRARNERIGLSPLKIRDYAAAGIACVATDIGGIEELRDEPWMFLAGPDDPLSYADAIASALAADRTIVRNRARAYAETHFDWSVVARQVSTLIG